jgi:hypothetical protein
LSNKNAFFSALVILQMLRGYFDRAKIEKNFTPSKVALFF